MKFTNKYFTVALISSFLFIPALAGCSTNADKPKEKDSDKPISAKQSKADVKSSALSMKQLLKDLNEAVSKSDDSNIKKSGRKLNNAWLSSENKIREAYPLLYTEIEKYLLPLYTEATSDKPDRKKLDELSGPLDESFTKLSNAKQSEEKTSESLNKAVEQYKLYVNDEVSNLVSSTKAFTDAVKAKDAEKAKRLYVESRTHYERIEPIAESFGDLDPKIDAREGDVDPAQWSGFHRIEKALWKNESLDAMSKVAEQLTNDVLLLQEKIKQVQLKPTEVVAGSMQLINEAAISKITGEEERYSHVDLMDLAANVEGSLEIYHAILPALAEKDKDLAAKLDKQFNELTATLNSHKKNNQYILYTELTKEQIRELSQKLGVLSELMGQTAKILQ